MNVFRLLIVAIAAALVLSGPSSGIAASDNIQANDPSQTDLLSDRLSGAPIAAGAYLFWKESAGDTRIFAYHLASRRKTAIGDRVGTTFGIASDGRTVAWVARSPGDGRTRIQAYDLRAQTTQTILELSDPTAISEIALDEGVLYYTNPTPGNRGLYARDLATGQERLISPRGMRPVAANGLLLWSEEEFLGPARPTLWSLHLRHPGSDDRVLVSAAAGYRGFSGYHVSGDYVVWAFYPSAADSRVVLYRISDGTSRPISTVTASNPLIHGDSVVWTTGPSGEPGRPSDWSVYLYDLRTHATTTIVAQSTAEIAASAIVGPDKLALALQRTPTDHSRELRIGGLEQRNLSFQGLPPAPSAQGACDRASPSSCGQVYVSPGDAALYDAAGQWTVDGVQFLLPEFGINSKTFRDDNYNQALADGTLDHWLAKAYGYLGAKTLRIFVEMPYRSDGELMAPTSYATLLSFASRANALGMRLGISLHNSSDWTMSAERAEWIRGLIAFFRANDALPAIAYLNADNEINNHCDNGGIDCFDSDQQRNAQPYIDGAIGWVAQFRDVVKSQAPELLITVGISTEMRDVDATRAVYNFFRPDRRGRTLASLVDFLAPHNYSGGAAGIIDDLRFNDLYRGPVVLEEYGYPTDPAPRNPYWTEGPMACRSEPLSPECHATAPFFVETNLRAIRAKGFAGSAAWMLADMREKNSSGACADPDKTFDLWTGLFAIGGTYCEGGTYSRNAGQPKATAYRVCLHHTGNAPRCEIGVGNQRYRQYFAFVSNGG